MKIRPQLELSPVPRPSWWQNFQKLWVQLAKVVNGNLEFGDPALGSNSGGNIFGTWITVTTPAVGTSFTVQHNLGKPAVGWIVFDKSAACDVWRAPTQPATPNKQLNLEASAAGVQLKIFVI